MSERDKEFVVGQRVFFWSGRGSQGYGTIREIRNGRALINPEPEAQKGSDYRAYPHNPAKPDAWAPRDFGVPFSRLNTPPRPWYQDN